jgi:serine protease inhibitor ecotin
MRTVDFDDWLNRWWLRLGLKLSTDPQTQAGVFRQLTRLKGLKETRQTKIELKSDVTEKVDVNIQRVSVKVELAQYERLIRETELQSEN